MAVRLRAADLAPTGETIRVFAGTWQVRLAGQTCVLESAEVRRE